MTLREEEYCRPAAVHPREEEQKRRLATPPCPNSLLRRSVRHPDHPFNSPPPSLVSCNQKDIDELQPSPHHQLSFFRPSATEFMINR